MTNRGFLSGLRSLGSPHSVFYCSAYTKPVWLWRLLAILRESITSWISHRAGSKSAALAFYTLFSITPILLLAIAIGGRIFGTQTAQDEIVAQVRNLVGPNGALAIRALLAAATDPSAGLLATLVASAVLVVGATSVFVELKGSLDELWGIDAHPAAFSVVFLKTRLLSFGMVLTLAFLLLISLVVSTALAMLARYTNSALGSIATFLASLVSFCVVAGLFAVIYKTLPDARLSWRDVWIGAAFTAGLFSLGKYVIGLYIGNSGVASSFGAAGSLIAVLLWVYYSAQIFFLGAEFTRLYALACGSLREQSLGVQ